MPTDLAKPFEGPMAWAAATMLPDDGLVRLDAATLDELRRVGGEIAAHPLPIEAMRPADHDMPMTRALLARVAGVLESGIGFAIIDRLPLGELADDVARKLYWLMMSMLGPVVAQKWDGTLVYDVTDTGLKRAPGNGVRSSKTNDEQSYHTDNAFNLPPDYVGLFCIRPAMTGGVSGLVSFETVRNRMLAEHADLVPRLHQPYYFDRQQEHAPGDAAVSYRPILEPHGQSIGASFNYWLVHHGYEVAGKALDARGASALKAFSDICEEDGMGKNFHFEPGQIQIVNNRRLGHRRTGYTDWPEGERKRHLVRLWVRKGGRRSYLG